MPLVTVVVPAFNAQRFIERAIRSLQAQTFPHWVRVIVNDGSSDSTREIAHGAARADPRITYITQKNGGPAAARNTGACAAQTPYILFLDADNELEAAALEILTAHLEEDGSACAAYCAGTFIDEGGTVLAAGKIEAWARSRFQVGAHGIETVEGQRTGFASFVFECRIVTPGMVLIWTEAFRAAGGFDEDLRLTIREDWDLWIRLSRSTPMRFVDLPLARYRRHDDNISGADIQAGLATWWLRMNTINSPCNRAGQRKLALERQKGGEAFMSTVPHVSVRAVFPAAINLMPGAIRRRLTFAVALDIPLAVDEQVANVFTNRAMMEGRHVKACQVVAVATDVVPGEHSRHRAQLASARERKVCLGVLSRQVLESLDRSITKVIVDLRLTTVRGCDEIVLLKHCKGADIGAFDDLVAEVPEFRQLAALSGCTAAFGQRRRR